MTNIDIQPYPPLRSHASEQQSNANQQQQGEQQQGHGQQQHSPNIPHHPGSWHAYGNSPTASNPSYHFTTPSSPSAPSPTTANRNGSGTPSQSHGQAQADGSGSQNGSSSSPGNNNDSAPQSHSNYGPDPNVPKPKPLACFRCKNKKGKCDDRMPICGPCVKANAECVRPSERKRKRTRKEMTEAELAEKERKARDSEKKARLAQASTDGGQSRADLDPRSQSHVPFMLPTPANSVPGSSPNYPTTAPASLFQAGTSTLFNMGSMRHPSQPSSDLLNGLANVASLSSPIYTTHPGVPDGGGIGSSASFHVNNLPPPPFQSNSSPRSVDTNEVVEALSKQIAFLEGDPGESSVLKVHYYRFSGSTAIHPGFNRIVIKLRSSAIPPLPVSGSLPSPHSPSSSNFNDINGHARILNNNDPSAPSGPVLASEPLDHSLVDVFFENFAQHFPFVKRERVNERLADGSMSAFLLNAMNAVAARFATAPARKPQEYIDAAWTLAMPLMRLPSRDIAAGLLLLSWAEFGENSESGLWNFAGLGMRMAIDLGLHKTTEDVDGDVCDGNLLFWSLYIMDRLLSLGTGRTVTITDDIIEVPLPAESELAPALNDGNETLPALPNPFCRVVCLFTICGRVSNILNGRRGHPRTLVGASSSGAEELQQLQNNLVSFLQSLPEPLKWSVDNFKRYAHHKHGGSFLFLHLWAHGILALIHHPNLGRNLSGYDTPLSTDLTRSIKLSLASSRQIADCLVFADLFDQQSYVVTPFMNQCLFIAGVAFVWEAQMEDGFLGMGSGGAGGGMGQGVNGRGPHGGSNMGDGGGGGVGGGGMKGTGSESAAFLSGLVRQNLSVMLKAMRKMQGYWAGISYIMSVLEQRASGLGWSKIDFSITSDKANTFISLPDAGLLRRIAGNGMSGISPKPNTPKALDLAHLMNPAPQSTDIANNWSFNTLLNSYQIEEVSASAAGFDVSSMFPEGWSW
ncbi:uncharacterized protein STEHIDRAFT_168323 [Stereum hirsutum FP-91666 SS1]|uniref:uncharacterized protein n=1 Tax=Stereum hirsutum (strain FP-91666) TaxID=721885 RepID=UPI000440C2B5|nr:uncharacterized protein STEHIDRAFT_168323 [Stereum hirsutum FP-91666 SS1]EIM87625.1 hypothetical protein STEHIDRAFT_168323 [Stereum hirsutum FP-91666 SS1]